MFLATSVSLFAVRKDEVAIDFLLVINTNVAPILHRFRDIAFEKTKIAINIRVAV